jgi:carbonic anhydrase
MERLIEGLRQFHGNVYPGKSEQFRTLANEGQSPTTLMISCADSRVVPELITQSEPGDLFVCRNAGNIVPAWQEANGGVSSTIEYAVVALGVTDIVICGHSDCGAMKGLMAPEALTTMPSVQRWLGHAAAAAETVKACHRPARQSARPSVRCGRDGDGRIAAARLGLRHRERRHPRAGWQRQHLQGNGPGASAACGRSRAPVARGERSGVTPDLIRSCCCR